MTDDQVETLPHYRQGVMEDTRVYCPENGVYYGPADGADSDMGFCPYCSSVVNTGDHRVDKGLGEVFCERTTMSTWRYCPGCGVELEAVE